MRRRPTGTSRRGCRRAGGGRDWSPRPGGSSGRRFQVACEGTGVERTSGGLLHELVPSPRGRRSEDVVAQVRAGAGGVDETAMLGSELLTELGGEELPVEVVLVVDGHHGEVDLGRPVGRATPLQAT